MQLLLSILIMGLLIRKVWQPVVPPGAQLLRSRLGPGTLGLDVLPLESCPYNFDWSMPLKGTREGQNGTGEVAQ